MDAPGEIIAIDYMHHNNQDVLVIKDKMSSYNSAQLCKNQTSQSTYMMPYCRGSICMESNTKSTVMEVAPASTSVAVASSF